MKSSRVHAAAAALTFFAAAGCEPAPKRLPGSEGPVREWMSLDGAGLRQYSRQGLEWVLLADAVEYERNTGEAIMKQIDLRHTWRRPDGRGVDIVMRAPDGRARVDEGAVRLSGGVKFQDSDENNVSAAEIDYDRSRKTLRSPGQVVFDGRGVRFEAPVFHADLDASVFTFTGGVRGRFDPALMSKNPALPGVGKR
ncbi:MAG: LPS export ABC transporter periplasmic protein LptC [Deltaproteobacteria bacterium]|nr:LPS export ABC transporter periplasmic protein LptC [Deltaproteobacteria bacterium]